MKNRKAKMLISRVYRRCYPSQWLRVSNRRMVLYLYSGIAREGIKDKPSAAQNRWKKLPERESKISPAQRKTAGKNCQRGNQR
ncbi:TPA: hypothetical protein L1421_001905 [Escherichia coli]|nr:hypothetical protein [Escherichia coli]